MMPLTPRQYQVVSLVAEGLPDKTIADRMNVQVCTVKIHLADACDRIGAKNRVQAAVAFVRGEVVAA